MYGEKEFAKLYAEIVNADETELLEPTKDLLELLCKAVFVEFPNWRQPPPLVPFTLDDGSTYHALEVGLKVSSSSLPHIFGAYDKIEFFVLKPDNALTQPARVAFRKTKGHTIVAKYVPLSDLPTSVLRTMVGRIKVCCPSDYATEHNDLREAVERSENRRREAAEAAQNP